jgi:hypothetical protein
MRPVTSVLASLLILSPAACALDPADGDLPLADVADWDYSAIDGLAADDPVADGFGNDRPCGDATLDHVRTSAGNELFFCGFDDGTVGVLEQRPVGVPALLGPETQCARDAYRLVAPGRAVPAALDHACAKLEGDLDATEGSAPQLAAAAAPQPGPGTDDAWFEPLESVEAQSLYCGANAAQNFISNLCYSFGTARICQANPVGWHQRTCSATVGGWCSHANARVAACGNAARFRAWSGKSLSLSLDFTVLPGLVAEWNMTAPSKTILFGWHDSDFRYRADSYSGGSHRYAISFRKN